MKKYILNFILLLLLSGCDYGDNRLKIKNHSKNDIAFVFSSDTILDKIHNIDVLIREKIRPGGTVNQIMLGGPKAWSFLIKNSNNKKLNAFIFNIDTLSRYSDLKYIIKNRRYIRYEFTEKKLEELNWEIIYQ